MFVQTTIQNIKKQNKLVILLLGEQVILQTDQINDMKLERLDTSLLEHAIDTHALSVYTRFVIFLKLFFFGNLSFSMISGTTGKPKGVVQSHRNVEERLKVLHDAWGWTSSDRILNFLPLHHVHGLYNVFFCIFLYFCFYFLLKCNI